MKKMVNILFHILLQDFKFCENLIYAESSIILEGTHLVYWSIVSNKKYLIHQQLSSRKRVKARPKRFVINFSFNSFQGRSPS